MAKKKEFTPELQQYMRLANLDYRYFELVADLYLSMMVKNKQTGEIILVSKEQIPKRFGK